MHAIIRQNNVPHADDYCWPREAMDMVEKNTAVLHSSFLSLPNESEIRQTGWLPPSLVNRLLQVGMNLPSL